MVWKILLLVAVLVLAFAIFWRMRTPSPKPLPPADRIAVWKGKRQLVLYAKGEPIRSYSIVLGRTPLGHKHFEGDGKTPEGVYSISGRNPESSFHLSLRISYPSEQDIAYAKAEGQSPGCDIMIHGFPNGADPANPCFSTTDWTEGCIAVRNEEIEEIWKLVPDGTPIEIFP